MTAACRLLIVSTCLAFSLVSCGNDQPEPVPVFGTLERDRIELRAHHAERIVELPVQEGQWVAKGQALVQLDDRALRAQWASVHARKLAAEAYLEELHNGPRPQEIARAQARLDAAIQLREESLRQLNRARSLTERKLAAESNEDILLARYTEAVANEQVAAESLGELQAGTRQERIEQAAANVAQIEADLKSLAVELDKLSVQAPQDGWLERLPQELGSDTLPGTVVATMLVGDRPYARIHVPEPRMTAFTVGKAVQVLVDGHASPLNGRVRYLSAEADFTPWLALNREDRERLSFVAEVDLIDQAARALPTGVPLEVVSVD